MKATKFLFAIVFTGFVSADLPGQEKTLSAYDKDGDSKLNQEEFEEMMKEMDLFGKWDKNSNDFLNVAEWKRGLERTYPEKDIYSEEAFRSWDMNADHYINEREFRISLFETWDEDASEYLTGEEFSKWNIQKEKRQGEGKPR